LPTSLLSSATVAAGVVVLPDDAAAHGAGLDRFE